MVAGREKWKDMSWIDWRPIDLEDGLNSNFPSVDSTGLGTLKNHWLERDYFQGYSSLIDLDWRGMDPKSVK